MNDSNDRVELHLPITPLMYDGERYTTAAKGYTEYEHLHRYLFARQFCWARRVLDVASGEGYGASLLAQNAKQVIGIDLSLEAVRHARDAYGSQNLDFVCGDCLSLPVESSSMDIFLSFETLEHVGDHLQFIQEAKRALRPNGLAVVSTPDRVVYSEETGYSNPFHKRELNRDEFGALIRANFRHAVFFDQRAGAGSFMLRWRAEQQDNFSKIFTRINETEIVQRESLYRARFLIAVASDCELPTITGGLFEDQRYAAGAVFDEAVREALCRAGAVDAAPLKRAFDLQDGTPPSDEKTIVETRNGSLIVRALNSDPRLLIALPKPDSDWLILVCDLFVENVAVVQVYTRSEGQEQVDTIRAVYRKLEPGWNKLRLLLHSNGHIDLVRFDPLDRPGTVIIRTLSLFTI